MSSSTSSSPNLRQDIQFVSGTEIIHAWLYTPRGADPSKRRPAIVIAHGLGGTKVMGLDPYGELYCSEGYVVLIFDYRHNGQSTGTPRHVLSIPKQLEDWRAAIAHVRTLDQVDPERVGLWGTSFAGGHVIKLASEDARLKVAISQCPFTSGYHSARQVSLRNLPTLLYLGLRDLLWATTRVHAVGTPPEVALMSTHDAIEGYLSISPEGTSREPGVGASIAITLPFYFPGSYAKHVACPIYFAICTSDTVAPSGPSIAYAKQAPRGTYKEYAYGHFSIYTGEGFKEASRDYVAFLKEHLPVEAEH